MAMISQLVYYARCYSGASAPLRSRVKRQSTERSYQNDIGLRNEDDEDDDQTHSLLYDSDRQTSANSTARSLAAVAVPTMIFVGTGMVDGEAAWEGSRRDLGDVSDLGLIPNCEPDVTVSAFRTSLGTVIGWVRVNGEMIGVVGMRDDMGCTGVCSGVLE